MTENGPGSLLIKENLIKNNNNNLKNITCNPVRMSASNTSKGRKTIVFWTLVGLLLLLALGNLILTLTIIGVLRLGYGMDSLELIPEESAVKFFGNADLGHVYKVDGKINGFTDLPVRIEGNKNGSVVFNLASHTGRPINKLTMNRNGTKLNHVNNFYVRNAYSSKNPHFNIPRGAKSISGKMVHSNKVLSAYNKSLNIKSDSVINLRGNEGTNIESKQIVWSADQDIYLKSINGSLVFSGRDGVTIEMKSIPIVSNNDRKGVLTTQFKLCVCLPHGKLFRIPVMQGQVAKVNCNHIKMTTSYNPCM